LLLLICSGNAAELLRDIHTDTEYIFKSDAKDVPVRISRKDALLRADEWAAGFYGDALLQFVKCQFKTQPIRHWLVAFQKAETGQEYFAIVLPDGRIVAPSVKRGLRSLPCGLAARCRHRSLSRIVLDRQSESAAQETDK
jgi:hypothetical protein